MDVEAEYWRWVDCATMPSAEDLSALRNDDATRKDAFCRNLAFGTGGLRGIIGVGPNRMNDYTVAKATQGLADYLNTRYKQPSVAIAHDSRLKSDEFCRTTACVLAANNIKTFMYPRIEPTPALSFAVRDLGCSAGICITASHNPAEYNGYKVYGADGCQITTDVAASIQAAIDVVDIFEGVKSLSFDDAVKRNLVEWIDDATIERFISGCLESSLSNANGALKVAYTPLHGTGLECILKVLARIGVDDVVVEPLQAIPDGHFPTCPYPNPENREALERGMAFAAEVNADLLLATDPDADRIGIAVFRNGEPTLLTGNEVGILLLDYICEMRAARNEDLRDAVVCTTIVSSAMADALCMDRGFELRRTLTGFKFIGEQIGLLEAEGQANRFMFGFEESCGYLAGTQVRDKDAMVASMLICEAARWYREGGMDLIDAMESLYDRYGYYRSGLVSITYPGADGANMIIRIMSRLRMDTPSTIAGLPVESVVDYASGVAMSIIGGRWDTAVQQLPPAEVLEFRLSGGNKLIVRPSGTEPKIKAYLFSHGSFVGDADDLLNRMKASAHELLGS